MKKYFIAGLATLLPLAITVWVALFLLDLLTKPFIGIVTQLFARFRLPEPLIVYASEFLILIALFFSIALLGMIARWYFFNALLRLGENILNRIPLINKVYKTTKDLTNSLFGGNKNFTQTVMLPFAPQGAYVIGLVARDAPRTCSSSSGEDLVSVFLPTTPNPTTGFLVLRPRSELIYLDIQPQDAIKYIVSCGATLPP